MQLPVHRRLKLIGIVIVLLGVLCSALIYFTTPDESDGGIGYEVVGDQVYPVTQGKFDRSQAEQEKFGGKFAVISAQLSDWFHGLWQGKQLGITMATLSIAVACLCFLFSYLLSFQAPDRDSPDSDN